MAEPEPDSESPRATRKNNSTQADEGGPVRYGVRMFVPSERVVKGRPGSLLYSLGSKTCALPWPLLLIGGPTVQGNGATGYAAQARQGQGVGKEASGVGRMSVGGLGPEPQGCCWGWGEQPPFGPRASRPVSGCRRAPIPGRGWAGAVRLRRVYHVGSAIGLDTNSADTQTRKREQPSR